MGQNQAAGHAGGASRGGVRRGLGLAGLVLMAALLWLGWSGYRAARELQAARDDLNWIEGLALDSSATALPMLQDDMASLEGHLAAARSAASPFLWLAPHLGWLPGIGEDVRNGPVLMDMGVTLASGGRLALDALVPAVEAISTSPETPGAAGQGDALARLIPALAQAGPALAQAEKQFAQAETLRAQISGPLRPSIERLLARVDQILPLARAGMQMGQMAPGLLGANGPRTYLLLAQNNHELKPTGGFLSGAGSVRIENGRLDDLRMVDSYVIDNLSQPHPAAPAVLAEQMGAQQLLMRDSNWWPDFPTSAQVARAIYEQDQGMATDGAVAVDLEGVRLLLGALGPISVPGIREPVTRENVIEQMQIAWAAPAAQAAAGTAAGPVIDWSKRKDFMGPLMTSALARLQAGSGLRMTSLAMALLEMLRGRHLQIAVDDAEASAFLARQQWDGGLRPPDRGDFLAVVDTNTGYNKTNAAVRQEMAYQVDADAGGLTATLTLTYTHTAPPLTGMCDRTPRFGQTYGEMIHRCYWDYLRVYVPAGSFLVAADGLNNALGEPGEQGTTVIGGNFMLRPSEQHVVTLRYRLPPTAAAAPYRLAIRMQAGVVAPLLSVRAGPCQWQTQLAEDRVFECSGWER